MTQRSAAYGKLVCRCSQGPRCTLGPPGWPVFFLDLVARRAVAPAPLRHEHASVQLGGDP